MKKVINLILASGVITGLICVLVSLQSPDLENYIMLFNLIPIFKVEEVSDGVIFHYQWGIILTFIFVSLIMYFISTFITKRD